MAGQETSFCIHTLALNTTAVDSIQIIRRTLPPTSTPNGPLDSAQFGYVPLTIWRFCLGLNLNLEKGRYFNQMHVLIHDFKILEGPLMLKTQIFSTQQCPIAPMLSQEYSVWVSQPVSKSRGDTITLQNKLNKKAGYICIHVDTRIQILSSTPILVEVMCERFSCMVSGCIDHWEANTEFIHASITWTLIYIQIHHSIGASQELPICLNAAIILLLKAYYIYTATKYYSCSSHWRCIGFYHSFPLQMVVLNSELYHWQVGVSAGFWSWSCKRGDNVDQFHGVEWQIEPTLSQEYSLQVS